MTSAFPLSSIPKIGSRFHQSLVGLLAMAACVAIATTQQVAAAPVKIFIMAGQSNTEGHGEISPVGTQGTLQYITANDPDGKYQFLKSGANWVVRDDVWMHYDRLGGSLRTGGLAPGFGARHGQCHHWPRTWLRPCDRRRS